MNAGVKFVMDCVLLGKSEVLQGVGRELERYAEFLHYLVLSVGFLVQMLMQWLDTVTEIISDTYRDKKLKKSVGSNV